MLGNICDLFVKYMQQVTKDHLYSETPLIRIHGDQLNLFEFEGFRIKDRARWFSVKLGKLQYLQNQMSDYKMQFTSLKKIHYSIL